MRLVRLLIVLVLLVAACDTDGPSSAPVSDTPGPADAGGEGLAGTLTVFAAASLTDAMSDVAAAFEDTHPDVEVELNFGPSSGLREQILAGAPADVFASANAANMDQVVEAGIVVEPVVFARNRLAIAVPAGNPVGITGLADFANSELFLGLCAEEVPCGSFARAALAAAGIEPALDTNAADVRALLTQIATGDLDAGIVYRTDVAAADDDVEGIEIPTSDNIVARYLIAPLTDRDDPALAEAFVTFVLSDIGQAILTSFGFHEG